MLQSSEQYGLMTTMLPSITTSLIQEHAYIVDEEHVELVSFCEQIAQQASSVAATVAPTMVRHSQ